MPTGLSLLPQSLLRGTCMIELGGENATIGPTNALGTVTLGGTLIATNGSNAGGSLPYNWNFASGGKYAMFDGFRNLDVVNSTKGHTWHARH